jgi:hypothetical protein
LQDPRPTSIAAIADAASMPGQRETRCPGHFAGNPNLRS